MTDDKREKELSKLNLTMKEAGLYNTIEKAIISWECDGTKTAGHLTRDLIKIIRKMQ